MAAPTTHRLRVYRDDMVTELDVPHGSNLRQVLLAHGLSPYAPFTRRLNCGGRGVCATCSVWLDDGEPAPQHWHDKAAARFGYPRLSCQVTVNGNVTVRLLTEKVIWGQRDPQRARRSASRKR